MALKTEICRSSSADIYTGNGSRFVRLDSQDALEHVANIDPLDLCTEAKVEKCRATRDLRSCGRIVQHILISCGHASLCAECSQRCDVCPICRVPIPNQDGNVRLRLYDECLEAGLICRSHDNDINEMEGDSQFSMEDVQRLYSLFDVALDNNLISLVRHYVTDVCMDESAVSSDPIVAMLLDGAVVKEWCKRKLLNVTCCLQKIYNNGVKEMQNQYDLLNKFTMQLDGVGNVLEVLEEPLLESSSPQLVEIQLLSETVSKVKQVAETRFASHTIVLRRLVKVKEALSLMVISNQWSIWKQSNTTRAQKVKAMILDDDWWVRVEYVLEFTEPIMSMLRFADTDEPCLGDVYDSMDTMLEEIKAVIQRRENDPQDTFYKRVEAIVHHRWNKMTTPLHLLAYALSPRYYSQSMLRLPGRIAPFRDSEVSKGALAALSKIFQDPEIGDIVRNELGSFVSGRDFGSTAVNDQRKMDAIKWWYLHGQDYRYLQPLAIKILSQVASSSAAERNWSTYSFIHSVKRNRLAAKKAEDLVFVHNNLRLVARKDPKYKKGPEKLWDVAPENADLDMTIQDLARSTLANLDDDDDDETHTIPSSASGTVFGSSESADQPLAAVGDPIDTDFFDNPFDD